MAIVVPTGERKKSLKSFEKNPTVIKLSFVSYLAGLIVSQFPDRHLTIEALTEICVLVILAFGNHVRFWAKITNRDRSQ